MLELWVSGIKSTVSMVKADSGASPAGQELGNCVLASVRLYLSHSVSLFHLLPALELFLPFPTDLGPLCRAGLTIAQQIMGCHFGPICMLTSRISQISDSKCMSPI